jgi:hypothetical protein
MHSQCKQKTLGRARIDIGERGEAIVMGWYSRYRIVWIRAFVGARGGRRGGEKTSSLCHRCQELCFSNFQRSCKVKLQRVTAAYGDGMCRGLNLGSVQRRLAQSVNRADIVHVAPCARTLLPRLHMDRQPRRRSNCPRNCRQAQLSLSPEAKLPSPRPSSALCKQTSHGTVAKPPTTRAICTDALCYAVAVRQTSLGRSLGIIFAPLWP